MESLVVAGVPVADETVRAGEQLGAGATTVEEGGRVAAGLEILDDGAPDERRTPEDQDLHCGNIGQRTADGSVRAHNHRSLELPAVPGTFGFREPIVPFDGTERA